MVVERLVRAVPRWKDPIPFRLETPIVCSTKGALDDGASSSPGGAFLSAKGRAW